MPLHPQARAMLDQLAAAGSVDLTALPPPLVREVFANLSPPRAPEPVAEVVERTLPGPAGEIPVRVYRPAAGGRLPAIAYFHGGGFVVGSLDTHDGTCRALANRSGCLVVSVDYRLAPEHRFPAAPEDCYAALRFLAERGDEIGADPGRLAVAGDSAGGNLAAVTALLARERRGPELRFQLLVYPVTNYRFDTDSYRDNGEGYLLTEPLMRWFWGHYLERAEEGEQPIASPLREKDLRGLPPALVITAEYDPLRDEGEAYAARLREADVPTTLRRYRGQIHGFFSMFELLDDGRAALESASAALREALSA
jgi:acetyl esterase/lipase